jgi:hypothetical protein
MAYCSIRWPVLLQALRPFVASYCGAPAARPAVLSGLSIITGWRDREVSNGTGWQELQLAGAAVADFVTNRVGSMKMTWFQQAGCYLVYAIAL